MNAGSGPAGEPTGLREWTERGSVDEAYTFGRHPRTYVNERQYARLLVIASYVHNGERYTEARVTC